MIRQSSSERGWLLDPQLRVRWLAASSKNTKVTSEVASATTDDSLSATYPSGKPVARLRVLLFEKLHT